MERIIETKFYEFTQNNSGGYFDVTDNVCHRVVIEAINEDHARSILSPMIEDQSPSCFCCGDRWSPYFAEEINIEEFKEKGYRIGIYSHYKDAEERWFKFYGEFPRLEEPKWGKIAGSKEFFAPIYFNSLEQYCQFLANAYGDTSPDIRIHYLDGSKKEIFIKK